MRRWLVVLLLLPATTVIAQTPGSGWMMSPSSPREVRTLYWELYDTTEVWVRLDPVEADGQPAPLSLIFIATYPGKRLARVPATISVQAQPGPLTIVTSLTLRLRPKDGRPLDLTAPGRSYQTVAPCDSCGSNAVIAHVSWNTFTRLAGSERADGDVLGFKVTVTPADFRALRAFERRLTPP